MARLVFLLTFLINSLAFAQLEYHSDRIKMMDIEILQQLVTKNLRKLETGTGSPLPLIKQSLEVVLAQPDQRLASSSIFEQLRSLSGGDETFTKVLAEIAHEAFASLKKDSKDQQVLREQNTYLYILNHMLAEIKPDKDEPEINAIIRGIRDADIEVSDALASYRLLNSMAPVENPSIFAAKIVPKEDPWYKFW